MISKTHVLTAAHCVAELVAQKNPFAVKSMTVEVGSTRIGGGRTHAIKRIAHKRGFEDNPWSSRITPYDVAVITVGAALNSPKDSWKLKIMIFFFSSKVQSPSLPMSRSSA